VIEIGKNNAFFAKIAQSYISHGNAEVERKIMTIVMCFLRWLAATFVRWVFLEDNQFVLFTGWTVVQALLTATHHSYGSQRLSDFFDLSPRARPPTDLTQNGSNDVDSRKDVPFAVNITNATFHIPGSSP